MPLCHKATHKNLIGTVCKHDILKSTEQGKKAELIGEKKPARPNKRFYIGTIHLRPEETNAITRLWETRLKILREIFYRFCFLDSQGATAFLAVAPCYFFTLPQIIKGVTGPGIFAIDVLFLRSLSS